MTTTHKNLWDLDPLGDEIDLLAERIVHKVEQREPLYLDEQRRQEQKAEREVDSQRGNDDFMEWVKNYAWAREAAAKELADATGYKEIIHRAVAAVRDVYVRDHAQPLARDEEVSESVRQADKKRYGRAYRAARDVYVTECRRALVRYRSEG